MGFRLADLHLTLKYSKGQDLGHPNLDCNISRTNITIAIHNKVEYELSISVFKFDLGLF